jgi:NCAIR mutase (PurE)-related protein
MAFNIKKRFDTNDIRNYISDSEYIGTADYYKCKFGNKLPEYYYDYFEVMARKEHDDNIKENVKNLMKKEQLELNKKIDDELNERLNTNVEELKIKNLNLNNTNES